MKLKYYTCDSTGKLCNNYMSIHQNIYQGGINANSKDAYFRWESEMDLQIRYKSTEKSLKAFSCISKTQQEIYGDLALNFPSFNYGFAQGHGERWCKTIHFNKAWKSLETEEKRTMPKGIGNSPDESEF